MPSWRSGTGRKALPEVFDRTGGPPGSSGWVWRPSRRSGTGQEALPVGRKWSRGFPGAPGVVCPLSVWSGELPSKSVNFLCPEDLPASSVKFLCNPEIFCQLSLQLGDLLLSFVNFRCCLVTFRQILSTFLVAGRPSFNFCHLSLRPEDLLSNYLCCWETFRQLP